MESGKVVRSVIDDIPVHGRDAAGVILAKPDAGDRILAVARNVERNLGADAVTVDAEGDGASPVEDAAPGEDPAPTEGDR